MCGITGILTFDGTARSFSGAVDTAVSRHGKRGPDANGKWTDDYAALGHARLSILDLSAAANQPMQDPEQRYVLVYNGEIFNFPALRKELQGVSFRTHSDTEVLLHLYLRHGKNMLPRLNGFFAFAIYDRTEKTLFLARDRMGVKPLVYYHDGTKFIFASEMKALLSYPFPRRLNHTSLLQYLTLTYIPAPGSILENVQKLEPGHCLTIRASGEIVKEQYYSIPYTGGYVPHSYEEQKKRLRELLEDAVRLRLISDVPLGCFLSGGLDSSVIAALAAKFHPGIQTFSIGYPDQPFFDETTFADMAAARFGTKHTVFRLTDGELYEGLRDVLQYLDEPFGDSSALPVFILSRHTRGHVTVALSGDGGDELFAGYNKHRAEYLARNPGPGEHMAGNLAWLWRLLPQSRNHYLTNKFRQLARFADALNAGPGERYWQWCKFQEESVARTWLADTGMPAEYEERKKYILRHIRDNGDLNEALLSDMHLVLPNDMLHKVDMMSMANGLEVRVPLLDYRVVDYVFSLPPESKIDRRSQKKIFREAFRDLLPERILSRSKHGFEVPLLQLLRKALGEKEHAALFEAGFIREQNIFNPDRVSQSVKSMFSSTSSGAEQDVWKILVFQHWYKNYFQS